MKTNILGIPITENNTIEGHSINKYIYTLRVFTSYYRMFRSNNPPYASNLYGICMRKRYKNENK